MEKEETKSKLPSQVQEIPICKELLDLINKFDSFQEKDRTLLTALLQELATQQFGSQVTLACSDPSFTSETELYLQLVLQLHQTLVLLEIDFAGLKSPKEHLKEVLAQIEEKGGLDYSCCCRSMERRSSAHGADPRLLIKSLAQTEQAALPKQQLTVLFKATLSDGQAAAASDEFSLELNRAYMELNLRSNGKMQLYIHAYVWSEYLAQVKAKLAPDFEDVASQHATRLAKFALKPKQVLDMVNKYSFSEKDYQRFIEEFGGRKVFKKVKLIEELQRALFVAQIQENEEQLHWIEKILIQLLGYKDIDVRDEAVIILNMLYDGIDWQLTSAFTPIVRCVGQNFKINLTVQREKQPDFENRIFLGLSAPSPLDKIHTNVLTWHKIEPRNITKKDDDEIDIQIEFGKFWKCGFYDWRVVLLGNDGRANALLLTKPPTTSSFPLLKYSQTIRGDFDDDDEPDAAQGRFVVQARGIRDQSFHEVQIDYENAEVDFQNKTFLKRGKFEDVEKAIPKYKESGISCLYLMGCLERDNQPVTGITSPGITPMHAFAFNQSSSGGYYKKPNASATAITSRVTPCEMLGGAQAFSSLVKTAKQEGVKVIVDCLARISSSRHHRKYKDLLLHYLDADGRRRICYGTDGQQQSYEDTAMLNYRKKAAWDLLIEEVMTFATNTGVDGIQLDNGQAWPQIFEPDLDELNRNDVDGLPAYSTEDMMNGEVVIRNENHGFWLSNSLETYANPFFIKLCRALWSVNPDFMILGECWGGFRFENRQIVLSRSGIIPRLYNLPQAIASFFGKKLLKDGQIEPCEVQSVTVLKEWYQQTHRCLPSGTIMLQSSSAHCWPYPAYLYGKGTWAAVDILYFLPEIPVTFMGEVDGEVYRLETMSVFQAEKTDVKSGQQIKRKNSQVNIALHSTSTEEAETTTQFLSVPKTPESGMPRVRSRSNLTQLLETTNVQDISHKEKEFVKNVGQEQGFDLKKIRSHYEHRRQIRNSSFVFRYGELLPLVAKNDDCESQGPKSFLNNVLAFARYSLMETAIISINLSNTDQRCFVDNSNLRNVFSQGLNMNSVVMVQNLLDSSERPDYYFLREFLSCKYWHTLTPYSSSVLLITACEEDKFTFQMALQRSVERTKEKFQNGLSIEAEQISQLFTDALKLKANNVTYFANLIGSLQEHFLDKIQMTANDLFLQNHMLTNDPILTANLMALCEKIIQAGAASKKPQIASPLKAARLIFKTNILGPIVFCTPEIGRWSTVGGLGVMVDELTLELAKMDQEVIVISPYYERNKRGVSGYLSTDPAGFQYVDNIKVIADREYEIGIHEGIVGNVRQVFLHHSEIFPSPYAAMQPDTLIRTLSVFGKACLEYLCARQIIPSICVTNDWFTGFVAAYAKHCFGETFLGTCFLHICHNLGETYEGRIYPEPRHGNVERIHQLPRDWLVDPSWASKCINPSRCALLMSDQWATVSKSYKEELLKDSPLAPILKLKNKPFAFPNGVPIKERIKKLDAAAPNHMEAKRMLQQKYFNYANIDDDVPVFAFVGRVTDQKGVHLILDVAEEIIKKYNYKVQFLVGGPADKADPYAWQCAERMFRLQQQYPNCFWADPLLFFTDGSLVNRGADFGLMPSKFEPGGIVQHEFFVGGTPVVAYSTGGLKDSVFEFMWDSETGSGFTFLAYKRDDFFYAIERAIGTYRNKQKYLKLRENAFNATMPGETVTKAWLQEFYRLRNKVYYNYSTKETQMLSVPAWNPDSYNPLNIFEEIFGQETKEKYQIEDLDFGAEEEHKHLTTRKIESEFDRVHKEKKPFRFHYHNRGPRFRTVHLCGSFTNWEKQHTMQFDHITNQWYTLLHLPRGEYFYKYVINGSDWRVNEEQATKKDPLGNFNNYIKL